jgi:hypothetical protein
VPLSTELGFLCIQRASFCRIALQVAGGSAGVCNGQYTVDFNAYAATQTLDPLLTAGATVDLQAWYSDPPNPGGANLTNAGRFVLGP